MDFQSSKEELFPLEFSALKVRLATRIDAERLQSLRVNAYGQAANIELIDSRVMMWNHTDEKNLVLVVENEAGELISTMKALLIRDANTFLRETNIIPSPSMAFPVLYLKTGSTAKPYWGNGLNTILKMEFVKYLLGSPIQNLINTINQGTSRIALLESLGFHFTEADTSQRKNSPFKFHTPLAIGVLNCKNFNSFLRNADVRLQGALEDLLRSEEDQKRIEEYLG